MPQAELERSARATSYRPTSSWSALRQGLAPAARLFSRFRRPDDVVEPYVAGVTPLARVLMCPALLGFFASVAIFLGATQPNSPFTLKGPGSWYFGIPPVPAIQGSTPIPGQGLFLGVVAVYGGMLLMLRAWYDVVRITSRYPGIPVARLVPVFCAWVAPLLVVAPLFSRDVYSYAAQGEMVTHGINPYHYGPNVLGATPFITGVDPLWRNVSSPYGPVFLGLAGAIVVVTGHSVLLSVVGLRLLALAGTVMFAVAVPIIARSFDRDAATAFTLAALNPLVLLHLVGGAHNDALMLGLLVSGYALSRRGRPVFGIIVCALAAAVKIPALIGVVYIGWAWLGPNRSLRERVRPVATALVLALSVMAAVSLAVGFGWGWINGLSNPDTVRSWLDPATGIGLLLGRVATAVGFPGAGHLLLTLARGSSLLLAGVISIWLLLNSERKGPLRALGWSLTAIVVLGPVLQPWYASWGFVFLAPIAVGRVRRILVVISGIACFVGLPGGHVLLNELSIANPLLVSFAAIALICVATYMVLPRVRRIVPTSQVGETAVTTRVRA